MNTLIASAWIAEELLLTAPVRRDRRELEALLHDDFYEIGQSGRRWSRHLIIPALVDDVEEVPEAELSEREEAVLSPDTVLLSYLLRFGSRVSRRSSIWRVDAGSVRCVFHQGTPVPAP